MNILIRVSLCECVNLYLGYVSVGGIAKSQGVHAHLLSVFLETANDLSQCCNSLCSCLKTGSPGLHLIQAGLLG